ncbi:murein DD-endopeptidase MepM/ murein hydrolase activator NlpD [Streptomyces umbrinus]|uniref:Murein DD-endopeptidase MepM/ murein hydrolase activator NlpD n=1 Tax=Streptomyces umbrinus TaxID=67370 RepID=A0ABU0T8N4_9ACTN|nr:M23 family metallopeptidase [Streptomyces umbrinus]MDQ1031927.1 murein DD-endopeptidase MepM/ murein hydrolase activator NlpD [Streptomyces umbrinus]
MTEEREGAAVVHKAAGTAERAGDDTAFSGHRTRTESADHAGPDGPTGATAPEDVIDDEPPQHEHPSTTPTTDEKPRPRRRGPGPFALIVAPSLVALIGVSGYLALTGGLSPDQSEGPDPAQTSVANVDASYVPWLRKAADACTVVTPSLLAAQIDQLSGWSNDGASLSQQGIAGFTDAQWRTWGRDDNSNGRSSPRDTEDAIMALGRQDCSLAEKVTDLRTEGTVSGNLVDLTLAAYTVGTDTVKRAGRVPADARTFLKQVKARLPRYDALVRRTPEQNGGQNASAVLTHPVSTLTVTSSFGSRTHPLTGVTKLHTGVDFGAPQGAQVSAARDGRIEFAGTTSAYGVRVVIDHGTTDGKRLQTTYSHLSALQVTAGQTVTTGSPIGLVGSTGLSTGPHLHFEVLLDGQYMDPLTWLSTAR